LQVAAQTLGELGGNLQQLTNRFTLGNGANGGKGRA
jgi:hypothetical protein